MKKRWIFLILLLCTLIALGAFLGPKVYRTVRAYKLVEEFWTSPGESLDVVWNAQGAQDLSFRLDWQDWQEKRIFTLETSGETFHYCDGVIYLKNGKGYRFSEAIPDLSTILEKPWLLIPLVEIQQEGTKWQLSAEIGEMMPEIPDINAVLDEEAGKIKNLQIRVQDQMEVHALRQGERTVLEVPQEVLSAIESGTVQGDKDLTQDLLRLIKGWMLLGSKDPLGMTVQINMDLLELPLSTELNFYTTQAYSKPIHYFCKNGTGIYFTEGVACTPEGVRIGSPEITVDAGQLLGFTYYLCLNGDLTCEGDVYRLSLDQQGMEQVLYTLLPEAKDMALSLNQGSLEIQMAEDNISAMNITLVGEMDLLITQVEINTQVNIQIDQAAIKMEIPQAVLDVLLE